MKKCFTRVAAAALALSALLLAAGSAFGQRSAPDASAQAARGKALYERNGCYECHLYTGAGYSGIPGGAPLAPMPLSLEAFTRFLRNPSNARRMPPYSMKLISDEDAAAIYRFIRTLPKPRPARDIPPLETIIDNIEHSGSGGKQRR